MYKTCVTVDSNDNITAVSYYIFKNNQYSLIGNTIVSNENNQFIVSDDIAKESLEYTIVNNKVTSYKKSFEALQCDSNYVLGGDNISSTPTTYISYYGNKTVVSCAGKERTTYFLPNGYSTFEVDYKKKVIEYKYDDVTKKLLRRSSVLDYDVVESLAPMNLLSFSNTNLTVQERNNTDFIDTISKVYQVEGTGTLRYSIPMTLNAGESIMLSIFGKELRNYSDTSRVKISLQDESDYFDKTTVDGNYDLITLGYVAKYTLNSVTIEIELTGNQKIDLCGLKVLKKQFGTEWEYDNDGHMASILTSNSNSNMTYDASGHVVSSQAKGQSKTNFEYNANELSKMYGPYGVTTEITKSTIYGLDVTTTTISCQDKTYTTKENKNNIGRLVSSVDENQNHTTYSYDSFGNVTNVTDVLSNSLIYLYNDYNEIRRITLSKQATSYKNNNG